MTLISRRTPSRRGSALIVALLLVLAVVGAAIALLLMRDDAPHVTPGPASTESASSAGAPVKPAPGDSRINPAERGREPRRAEKGIAFSVVCLGPGGAEEPLRELDVVAVPATVTGTAPEYEVRARTDAKGIATFTNLPYQIYEVSAQPTGLVPLCARGAKDGTRLEFLFRKGTSLVATVTNGETDAPIEGAYVQVRTDFGAAGQARRIQTALRQGVDPRDIQGYEILENPQPYYRADGVSDAAGRIEIANVPFGTVVSLAAEHDSFDSYAQTIEPKDGEPLQVELRLLPRVDIVGKVLVDETGEPIPGVKVQASDGGMPLSVVGLLGGGSVVEAVTDANGAYRLRKLQRGKQFVAVSYPGYDTFEHAFEVSSTDPEYALEVRLKRTAALSGRVVDNANQPIEGVSVYFATQEALLLGGKGLPAEPHARTGPDGGFRLRGVPPGRPFSVVVRHPSFVNAQRDNVKVEPGEELAGVDIMMTRGGSITGEVVDALRQPLAGATIVATPVKPVGAPLRPIVSGADGTFVIDNTQPAIFELSCEAPGYCKSTLGNVRDDATGVQFVLVKEAIYAGRFLDGAGKPLPRFKVRMRLSNASAETLPRVEQYRDKEGAFEIGGLVPGLWDFEFSAEGVTPLLVERVALREAERIEKQELRVNEGGRVGGVVKSLSGKPVQAALVRMEFLESFSSSDKTFTTLQSSTNSNGEFEIKNLLPGRYNIWASHPSFAPMPEREIVVDVGPRQDIDFSMQKPANLRVVIRDEEGNTVPTAEVWLFQGDHPMDQSKKIVRGNMVGIEIKRDDSERTGIATVQQQQQGSGPKVRVGETGEVTFSRKEPGEWTLWVTGTGYYKYIGKLNLEPGKESVHEAKLVKLQPGVLPRDAITTDEKKKHREDRFPDTGEEGPTFRDLTTEQRAVIEKQRDGEELTADEMQILKEARRLMQKGKRGEEGKAARADRRKDKMKDVADADGDGVVSPEESAAHKARMEKMKQKRAEKRGEGGDGMDGDGR